MSRTHSFCPVCQLADLVWCTVYVHVEKSKKQNKNKESLVETINCATILLAPVLCLCIIVCYYIDSQCPKFFCWLESLLTIYILESEPLYIHVFLLARLIILPVFNNLFYWEALKVSSSNGCSTVTNGQLCRFSEGKITDFFCIAVVKSLPSTP